MYTFNSRIRYSETDVDGKLTVTGITNYLQDCSTFQSEDLGLGVEFLKSRQRAWWLSSWQIVIDRYPVLGEEVVVGTWPYDFKGMYGYRNFTIQDKLGNYLVRANSVWFFFDLAAGRPTKVQESDIRGYQTGRHEPLEMNYAPRRIQIPDKFEEREPIVIAMHHIDSNRHVNNAQYIELAKELLPEDFVIGEVRVEYKKAAVFGDVVIPRVSTIPEGFVISLGDTEGTPYAVTWLGRLGQRGNMND